MAARTVSILIALTLNVTACSSEKDSEPAAAPKAEEAKPRKRSNVKRITLPVPPGKHVACEDLIPDPAKFAEYLGGEIGEVRDRGKSNSQATAVCALMRAGEPPKTNKQLKDYKKSMKLGVLPGDEFCMVNAMCSFVTDPERFAEDCEKDGNSINEDLGYPACVRTTQRASEWAYTYRVIEPDSKCILEVMGGPSVTDEVLVQNCTRAAVEAIGAESIKNFK